MYTYIHVYIYTYICICLVLLKNVSNFVLRDDFFYYGIKKYETFTKVLLHYCNKYLKIYRIFGKLFPT